MKNMLINTIENNENSVFATVSFGSKISMEFQFDAHDISTIDTDINITYDGADIIITLDDAEVTYDEDYNTYTINYENVVCITLTF